jgi:hypothetical protein
MHLYGDILEKYVSRDLPAQMLGSIDAHVSNCLSCTHALAAHATADTNWERRGWLGRLVRVDAPGLTDTGDTELRARAA